MIIHVKQSCTLRPDNSKRKDAETQSFFLKHDTHKPKGFPSHFFLNTKNTK